MFWSQPPSLEQRYGSAVMYLLKGVHYAQAGSVKAAGQGQAVGWQELSKTGIKR